MYDIEPFCCCITLLQYGSPHVVIKELVEELGRGNGQIVHRRMFSLSLACDLPFHNKVSQDVSELISLRFFSRKFHNFPVHGDLERLMVGGGM